MSVADVGAERVRTTAWEDPVATAEHGLRLSGAEYIAALIAGDVPPPPIAVTLGFEVVEASEGRAVFACEAGEHLHNPIGSVHGGVAATLLETATRCGCTPCCRPACGIRDHDLHVTFVRPIGRDTGRIVCTGEVLHAGRRMATAEGRLVDGDGRLLAQCDGDLPHDRLTRGGAVAPAVVSPDRRPTAPGGSPGGWVRSLRFGAPACRRPRCGRWGRRPRSEVGGAGLAMDAGARRPAPCSCSGLGVADLLVGEQVGDHLGGVPSRKPGDA